MNYLDKGTMSNKQKLSWLRWLAVFVPPLLVWVYETVRHSMLAAEVDDWFGNLISALIVLMASFVFANLAFGLIGRMQSKIISQNRQLRDLNQRIKELAIVEERSRLSREIHDGLAQLLAYIMIKIDVVETLLRAGRLGEAERELEQVRKACNDAYGDVREAITGLRPELFDDRDFITILKDLLQRFNGDTGLETDLEIVGFDSDIVKAEQLFPPAVSVQLLRVVQEALSNIRKHAQAHYVSIQLSLENSSSGSADSGANPAHPLRLKISDDGAGFDPANLKHNGKHFGQTIMRERVESLGGALELFSRPGNGTTLLITLPLPVAEAILSEKM
jgi:signal transduction histidine kinase